MLVQKFSNITQEQAEKIIAEHEQKVKERQLQAEKTASCPVCGARRARERVMSRFEQDILSFLRDNRLVAMDSCILCVQKHVGTAMQLYKELLRATASGTTDGKAAVNVKLNHLAIIGELQCAIKESTEYTDLNTALIAQERQYRYEGIEPDWSYIAALIVEYEGVIEASGANKA